MHLLWYKSNIAEFAQSRFSFGNIFLEIFPLTLQSAFYFATELQMGELVRTARSLYTTYLIFVIFFTRAKFLENKIYTEKRQFFALNL